ncbi:hypothetical protein [Streptomyces cinereospinus]|uniref:Uncharacterized protein n=1 Tax=Streptomyces cinereospinus TaxID=285561 RepID=A0ABV5N806_9ACTN
MTASAVWERSHRQDPYAQSRLRGCVGQLCYVDDIQCWSTNETTVNWNAALARMASFVADQGRPPPTGPANPANPAGPADRR